MNRKDILFRRTLMAREIRNSKAAELFSKGAWLPVMKHTSTYNSNGYYYIASYGRSGTIAGSAEPAFPYDSSDSLYHLPGNVVLQSGHTYLVSVWLEGYTPYYNNSSYNIRLVVRDPSTNVVSPIFGRTGENTINQYMVDTYNCNYGYGDVSRSYYEAYFWECYSATPFTMYSSVKKIS